MTWYRYLFGLVAVGDGLLTAWSDMTFLRQVELHMAEAFPLPATDAALVPLGVVCVAMGVAVLARNASVSRTLALAILVMILTCAYVRVFENAHEFLHVAIAAAVPLALSLGVLLARPKRAE